MMTKDKVYCNCLESAAEVSVKAMNLVDGIVTRLKLIANYQVILHMIHFTH
jgi:hypothetical protein